MLMKYPGPENVPLICPELLADPEAFEAWYKAMVALIANETYRVEFVRPIGLAFLGFCAVQRNEQEAGQAYADQAIYEAIQSGYFLADIGNILMEAIKKYFPNQTTLSYLQN